jgi:hypothetical protein
MLVGPKNIQKSLKPDVFGDFFNKDDDDLAREEGCAQTQKQMQMQRGWRDLII